ncbi:MULTISPECIES: sensor histidine kinase [unclassified Exiguobacterium]|uniref:sensor histidine kinase n=1 Tax=unclassified Exiguobacterium TaxID=2644629 RepID=UPI00103AAA01|nr:MULTISPECIES: histidine kinase [unclassified Exiguobacterium]TCI48366.1 histidine kinase [Exiguobacterium sp. SH5S32]TCI55254.1 histidine kinase [Exiguobacterium sp. SH1S4]TCI63266.1 histidine kinase [Exiguobacterium sp. SH0S2]TCI75046.1 histidine kinase [Exiguobacterium sp. SH1S1]
MTPKYIGLTLLILLLALTGGLTFTRGQSIDSTATVIQGTADLSASEVTDTIVRLDGTWRFQSSLLDQVDRQTYRNVPYVTPHQVATYEVDVSLPPGQYALRVPRNHPHIRLAIDGEAVSPVYSSTPDSRHAYLVLLDTHTPDFRLTMQVTRSDERTTGIQDSLLIGPTSSIMALQNKFFTYDFIIILISLLIFSFYAIVFMFHRKESLYLYGAAFFFLIGLSLLTRDQMIIFEFIPAMTYVVAHKFSMITGLLSLTMLIGFALRLEQVPFSRFLSIASYPLYAFSLIALIIPYSVHATFDYVAWVYVLVIALFWTGLNIHWLFERKDDRYPFEFLIFTLALVIGYIGQLIYVFITHPNQVLYSNVLSLIYFLLMFMLLPVHLSTDKKQKREVQTFATQSEISFFNSQIKPHFLYNTFGNVIALCYTAPNEAARLLSHLSTYVRFIFENGRTETDISLRQELGVIDSYLMIEQTRFDGAFTIIKEIDETVLDALIPPLLIQPLVENAVQHGLMKQDGVKRLLLSVQDAGDMIDIRISDNGVGFDPKAVLHEVSGIGIPNVKSRIGYLPDATFKLNSEHGVGTNVHIRLPKRERMTVTHADNPN